MQYIIHDFNHDNILNHRIFYLSMIQDYVNLLNIFNQIIILPFIVLEPYTPASFSPFYIKNMIFIFKYL